MILCITGLGALTGFGEQNERGYGGGDYQHAPNSYQSLNSYRHPSKGNRPQKHKQPPRGYRPQKQRPATKGHKPQKHQLPQKEYQQPINHKPLQQSYETQSYHTNDNIPTGFGPPKEVYVPEDKRPITYGAPVEHQRVSNSGYDVAVGLPERSITKVSAVSDGRSDKFNGYAASGGNNHLDASATSHFQAFFERR